MPEEFDKTDLEEGMLVIAVHEMSATSHGGHHRIDTINGPDVTKHRDDPAPRPGMCSLCEDTGIMFLPQSRTVRERLNCTLTSPCECDLGQSGMIMFEQRGRNGEQYAWFYIDGRDFPMPDSDPDFKPYGRNP